MKFDYRTIEAAASAIAYEKGLREHGRNLASPNVAKAIDSCTRAMNGTVRVKVNAILNSDQRDLFIAAVQKMISDRYGA